MTFRAFIAVEVKATPELVEYLDALGRVGQGLKPVSPDQVHITLKFLGDTDEDKVQAIEVVMQEAVRGIPSFEIQMSGAGVFPNRNNVRVVWAGMTGTEPLELMTNRIEGGLEPLGFVPEGRPFRPHITLARVKDPRASFAAFMVAEKFKDSKFGTEKVTSIKLKKSVLTRFGPEYSDVAVVPLH